MLSLYILAALTCLIALITIFNHYCIILLPRRKQELCIIAEGNIPHIDVLMHELYIYLRRKNCFEPQFINHCCGESHIMMEKFCLAHGLPCKEILPAKRSKRVYIHAGSNIRRLRQEISRLKNEIDITYDLEQRNA